MISLSELSLNCQKNAMQNGALVPLETEIIYSDAWSPFILRKLLGPTPKHLNKWGPRANPFFPWDRNLEVLELDDHVLLLNKYPVEPGHLLLISKGWQPQGGWLTRTDWQALVDIWQLQNGLWFFNSSPSAGASQPHRHLQLLPRSEEHQLCPEDPKFMGAAREGARPWPWRVGIRAMPAGKPPTVDFLVETYGNLAAENGLGLPSKVDKPLGAYNLLISRNWFVLIPRKSDGHEGFSLNALGYAGYLLATNESNLAWLEINGPNALLAHAAVINP